VLNRRSIVQLEDLGRLRGIRHRGAANRGRRPGRSRRFAPEALAHGERRVKVRLAQVRVRPGPKVDTRPVHELDPRDVVRGLGVHVHFRLFVRVDLVLLVLVEVDEPELRARVGELAVAGHHGKDHHVRRLARRVDVRLKRRRPPAPTSMVFRGECQPDHGREGCVQVDRKLPVLVLSHGHQAQVDVGSGNRADH
jgi:hypothetical protein